MEDAFSKFAQRFAPADAQPSPEDTQESPDAMVNFMSKMGGSGPLETLLFYNGTVELRYDKVNHLYFKVDPNQGNLIPVDGVTTACHIIDRSIVLVPWAAKKVIEKLLGLVPTYTTANGILMVKEMTFEEFTKIALDAKTAPKDVLEDAGDVGHMAHSWLEDYIIALRAQDTATQRGMLTTMCKDERATNCVIAALDWMKSHNVRWQETERKVYSREYDYSGTTDGRCLVDSCSDLLCCATPFKDRLSTIDWKSSNFLYIEYLFQTAAYEQAEREELGLDIKDRWLLRLGKEDGKFETWHLTEEDFAEDFSGFLACLSLYRLVKSVEERMNIQKRTKRAAKKQAKAIAKEIAIATEKAEKAIAKAQKKLEREQAKATLKAQADKAKADKKATRELEKAALKIATKAAKGKKMANETEVLLGRTAELSPKVAALLEEAHTGDMVTSGIDVVYPGTLTTPVLKGTDEELQMQCVQLLPLPERTEEESFPMFKLPEEKL